MTDEVPPAVRKWFKTTYPTLVFEQTWLAQCSNYLQTHFDLTPPQLIKKVEYQLLLSDLSLSTSSSPLSSFVIPEGNDFEGQPKAMKLPDRGILVQIQSINEIGHPALSLQTIHQKILDEAQGRDRVLDLEDVQAQKHHGPILYPRAMLKFDLSDGHNIVPAIEYKKIDGLGLTETPLGCKLLIKSATVRRGLVLLTPENTQIKGFQIDELNSNRDEIFQNVLNARLGQNPVDQEATRAQQPGNQNATNGASSLATGKTASIVNTHDPPSTNQPAVIELSDSDDYFDDNSDFEAQLLAQNI